jgi:hypothetical protein
MKGGWKKGEKETQHTNAELRLKWIDRIYDEAREGVRKTEIKRNELNEKKEGLIAEKWRRNGITEQDEREEEGKLKGIARNKKKNIEKKQKSKRKS